MHAMTLQEYINEAGITAHQFARQAGINHATVGRLLAGDQVPRADTALKIHDITGGKVTLEDWRRPNAG